jgi:hypothetical protein
MKIAVSIIVGLMSVSSFATTIQKKQAIAAHGGTYEYNGIVIKNAVTQCTYVVMDDPIENDVIRILVYSDAKANTSFMLKIPRALIPLKDGIEFEKSGFLIGYKDGLLQAEKILTDRYSFYNEKYLMMEVSADLLDVKNVWSIAASSDCNDFGRPIDRRKIKELGCRF